MYLVKPYGNTRIEMLLEKVIDPIVEHITIIAGIFLFRNKHKTSVQTHVTFLLSAWLFELPCHNTRHCNLQFIVFRYKCFGQSKSTVKKHIFKKKFSWNFNTAK